LKNCLNGSKIHIVTVIAVTMLY